MAKWIPDSYLELALVEVMKSNEEAVCSQQPTTFFEAAWGDLWTPVMTVTVGQVVHPPTQSGFVYECIVAGDTNTVEPGWGTNQDDEFDDGTARWKTHRNYALASHPIVSGDFTLGDGTPDGRGVTVAQVMGVVTHTSGTVTHTALIEYGNNVLHSVTTSHTTLGGGNDVEAGRSTIFFPFTLTIRDPQ